MRTDRPLISGQVAAVFAEAARVIATRSDEPINPLEMDNPAAIRQVLPLLCRLSLRRVVANAVGLLDDPLALSLVSEEPDVVAKGAKQVRDYLAAKRTARRREATPRSAARSSRKGHRARG